MSVNLNDIFILNINGADCCCIISTISKSETIKLMQNIDMVEKSGILSTIKIIIFFIIYIKKDKINIKFGDT